MAEGVTIADAIENAVRTLKRQGAMKPWIEPKGEPSIKHLRPGFVRIIQPMNFGPDLELEADWTETLPKGGMN